MKSANTRVAPSHADMYADPFLSLASANPVEKKSPSAYDSQVRKLLEAVLPLTVFHVDDVLRLVAGDKSVTTGRISTIGKGVCMPYLIK